MPDAVEKQMATKQSTLQKILTSAVNDSGIEAILVAVIPHEAGPLTPQVSRGFTSREIRAILRTLSLDDWKSGAQKDRSGKADTGQSLRLRMVNPGSKVVLAIPLRYGEKIYGTLVVGRKETATLSKRDRTAIDRMETHITEELGRGGLLGSTLILGQPFVGHEPFTAERDGVHTTQPRTYTSPKIQEKVAEILGDVGDAVLFDRAWVTIYDPIAASLEVLGVLGGQKRDIVPGNRLPLDESASGWAVRHRKPRSDQNLASTQGRFQDYRQLYKDRFSSTMVVPFFVRGRVAGTVTFASKDGSQYKSNGFDLAKVQPVTTKLVELFEDPSVSLSVMAETHPSGGQPSDQTAIVTSEPAIRREERRVALHEVSSFLATEIREPMGFIRAQLEEITTEAHLDFDSQTRVEIAMRDLMRVEALLHEILDFTKPLELDRRMCRVQEVLDRALSLVSTDLRVNRIEVTKEYPARLTQVRWDEAKMQHAFLSIFKNALEAMSPGGHLRVAAALQRGRRIEVSVIIENDGVPIPPEHVDKVFEPYFTTKRSGTGLGLATVKKIVEEHQGRISITSGPDKGTKVMLRMPALRPRTPYRGRREPGKTRRTS